MSAGLGHNGQDEWGETSIGEVVVRTKQRDPRKFPGRDFRYVDVSSVSNELFAITEAATLKGAEAPSRARKEIAVGDVLFATVRPTLKRVARVPTHLDGEIASTGYCVLRPKHDAIDSGYLYYYLLTDAFIARMADLQRGASYPSVRESDVFRTVLQLPALAEQRRIACVLGTVQQAIEQQERLIRSTTELKQALMQKLFTEGLRGEAQKETEIGLVPESWEVVRFDAGVNIKNGQVDPRIQPYDDMPHVGSENIESGTGRLIKIQTNKELGIGSGNYYFTPEDVLYSKIRPHLNKVALPDFEGTCSADMYPLRSEGTFNREYLFYYLLTDTFKNAAVSYQDRTGIPKINRVQLGGILLPKPSIVEQKEIAQTLTTCDRRLDCANRKRTALQDLFRTLLHALMTGKVRVGETPSN